MLHKQILYTGGMTLAIGLALLTPSHGFAGAMEVPVASGHVTAVPERSPASEQPTITRSVESEPTFMAFDKPIAQAQTLSPGEMESVQGTSWFSHWFSGFRHWIDRVCARGCS